MHGLCEHPRAMDASATPGASCPTHAELPLRGACLRCGGFLCAQSTAASVEREAVIGAGFAIPLRQKARVLPAVLDLRLRTPDGPTAP